MSELELIGPRPPRRPRPGQQAELYRRGDEYFWVSTVPDVGNRAGLSAAESAVVDLVGRLDDYPTSDEETMAFLADSEGEVLDWTEVALAVGPGSREAVLEQLRGAT